MLSRGTMISLGTSTVSGILMALLLFVDLILPNSFSSAHYVLEKWILPLTLGVAGISVVIFFFLLLGEREEYDGI